MEEIAKTFEWSAFDVLLRGLHGSADGAPAYLPLTMFKIVLLQQWRRLSDPGAEEAVRDRLSFRRVCGYASDLRSGPRTAGARSLRARLGGDGGRRVDCDFDAGFPGPRHQLVDPGHGMVWHGCEHVGEPGSRIDVIELACMDAPVRARGF